MTELRLPHHRQNQKTKTGAAVGTHFSTSLTLLSRAATSVQTLVSPNPQGDPLPTCPLGFTEGRGGFARTCTASSRDAPPPPIDVSPPSTCILVPPLLFLSTARVVFPHILLFCFFVLFFQTGHHPKRVVSPRLLPQRVNFVARYQHQSDPTWSAPPSSPNPRPFSMSAVGRFSFLLCSTTRHSPPGRHHGFFSYSPHPFQPFQGPTRNHNC